MGAILEEEADSCRESEASLAVDIGRDWRENVRRMADDSLPDLKEMDGMERKGYRGPEDGYIQKAGSLRVRYESSRLVQLNELEHVRSRWMNNDVGSQKHLEFHAQGRCPNPVTAGGRAIARISTLALLGTLLRQRWGKSPSDYSFVAVASAMSIAETLDANRDGLYLKAESSTEDGL